MPDNLVKGGSSKAQTNFDITLIEAKPTLKVHFNINGTIYSHEADNMMHGIIYIEEAKFKFSNWQ